MRVLHAMMAWVALTTWWTPGAVGAQHLIANRFFAGTAVLSVSRPDLPATQQVVDVEATFSTYDSNLSVSLPGESPLGANYGFIEIPQGSTSIALLLRQGPANGLFPTLMLCLGQARAEGNAALGIGWISGTDTIGPYYGYLLLQLQQPLLDPPSTPEPPPPPPPDPNPTLPAFDGTTLRVPSQWSVRKFEGWAVKLTQKYGTLPGGTTATVPSAWGDGVMQCHGSQGYIYEIPLTLNYEGFVNGSILYAPDGTWPSWEPRDRWHAIAAASGYTKYVFR